MFLRIGAVVENVVGTDAVHTLSKAADAPAPQLLIQHSLVPEVPTGPPVLRRYVEAEHPHFAHPAPHLTIHVVLRSPAPILGKHFRLDEPRYRIAKRRQLVVHPWRPVGHLPGLSLAISHSAISIMRFMLPAAVAEMRYLPLMIRVGVPST